MTASEPVLQFRWEWEDAPSVRSPELRATWARLEVWVGGDCVSRVEDVQSESARRSIYVPLYPLAEWIAYNWWLLRADGRPSSLLVRPGAIARFHSRARELLRRHSLRAAGDGFSWPDLVFVPEGASTRLVWHPDRELPEGHLVRFLSRGDAYLPGVEVQRELSSLVEAVLTRLSEQGVTPTVLADEWAEIQRTDPEEEAFCLAAARLGLDPYAETEDVADQVLRASSELGEDIAEDFLNAVDPTRIAAALEWIVDARGVVSRAGAPIEATAWLRQQVRRQGRANDRGDRPWEIGWRQAREVRTLLDMTVETAFDPDQYVRSEVRRGAERSLQALGGVPETGPPVLVLGRQQSQQTSRFTLARALWRILYRDERLFLVTGAHTERQRAERAFAAELLAPAEGVAARLGDDVDTATPEDLELVAEHFGVSSMVVEHQVGNQLADVRFAC